MSAGGCNCDRVWISRAPGLVSTTMDMVSVSPERAGEAMSGGSNMKCNHENTKERNHEKLVFVFSQFHAFVIGFELQGRTLEPLGRSLLNDPKRGIGISAVPSLPKAVRRVRLPYPAINCLALARVHV